MPRYEEQLDARVGGADRTGQFGEIPEQVTDVQGIAVVGGAAIEQHSSALYAARVWVAAARRPRRRIDPEAATIVSHRRLMEQEPEEESHPLPRGLGCGILRGEPQRGG